VRFAVGLCLLLGTGCAAVPPESPATAGAAAMEAALEPGARAIGDDGEPLPPSRPRVRTGNPWVDCYRSFQPGDDPAADLAHLTHALRRARGARPVAPIHVGQQDERGRSERLVLRARKGRCYRVFALGAPSIADLDVAVFDPQGHLLTADLSRDRWSVVPPLGPLCAPQSGLYTMEIAVTDGSGEYLLQAWGTPEPDDEDATPAMTLHRARAPAPRSPRTPHRVRSGERLCAADGARRSHGSAEPACWSTASG